MRISLYNQQWIFDQTIIQLLLTVFGQFGKYIICFVVIRVWIIYAAPTRPQRLVWSTSNSLAERLRLISIEGRYLECWMWIPFAYLARGNRLALIATISSFVDDHWSFPRVSSTVTMDVFFCAVFICFCWWNQQGIIRNSPKNIVIFTKWSQPNSTKITFTNKCCIQPRNF